MQKENPSWSATSSKWKEASRTPRKPVLLGVVVAMIAMTSAIAINAQAFSIQPAPHQQDVAQMPAHAPTIHPAKTSAKETISLFLDLLRQTSRKTIS